ncbi:MAG: hypothetical protein RLZZ237_3682, partial [Pseudomonadota bacterium]
RQDQLCSDIAKDGRFALSCCEQRQQRDSASRHRGNGVELAVAADAMKAYETLEEDDRGCLSGSHAQSETPNKTDAQQVLIAVLSRES